MEKKLELLRSEHNEEIEKQNQVLDDVTKPTNLLGMNWIYAKLWIYTYLVQGVFQNFILV